MLRYGRSKDDGPKPAQVEVEVGLHRTNDLKKKAANGDQLSAEELEAVLEADRPSKTQDRPTGRTSRTGTEVKKETSGRKHAEKWARRQGS